MTPNIEPDEAKVGDTVEILSPYYLSKQTGKPELSDATKPPTDRLLIGRLAAFEGPKQETAVIDRSAWFPSAKPIRVHRQRIVRARRSSLP